MSATSSISAASPKRGVSSFTLKVVAIVGMTFNHACYIFYPYLPAEALLLLFGFGGLTFPIMAFLLVEGYHHTSNIKRYAGRLLAFALVSQVPYGLFLAHNLNVLFTLLIGLGILYLYDTMESRGGFWLAAAALVTASALCDWGIIGPLMILMMRAIPDRRQRIVLPLLVPILGNGLPALSDYMAAFDPALLPFALYRLTPHGILRLRRCASPLRMTEDGYFQSLPNTTRKSLSNRYDPSFFMAFPTPRASTISCARDAFASSS